MFGSCEPDNKPSVFLKTWALRIGSSVKGFLKWIPLHEIS